MFRAQSLKKAQLGQKSQDHFHFSSTIPEGPFCILRSLETDESEALAEAEVVDGHFGGIDVAEPIEHHFKAVVVQILVQVLDVQVVPS